MSSLSSFSPHGSRLTPSNEPMTCGHRGAIRAKGTTSVREIAAELTAQAIPAPRGETRHPTAVAACWCEPDTAPASRRASESALVLPEPLEPIRRQRRVAHCRGNRTVAEVVLDRPRVLAVVGQLIPARVAQHVAVNEEREAGSLTSTSDHALIPGHRERRQALGNEDVLTLLIRALFGDATAF